MHDGRSWAEIPRDVDEVIGAVLDQRTAVCVIAWCPDCTWDVPKGLWRLVGEEKLIGGLVDGG